MPGIGETASIRLSFVVEQLRSSERSPQSSNSSQIDAQSTQRPFSQRKSASRHDVVVSIDEDDEKNENYSIATRKESNRKESLSSGCSRGTRKEGKTQNESIPVYIARGRIIERSKSVEAAVYGRSIRRLE